MPRCGSLAVNANTLTGCGPLALSCSISKTVINLRKNCRRHHSKVLLAQNNPRLRNLAAVARPNKYGTLSHLGNMSQNFDLALGLIGFRRRYQQNL